MQEFNLSFGKESGLMIRDNKIAIQTANNSLIRLGSDGGLYVASLTGNNTEVDIIGSSCDGHTIIERSSGGIIRPTTNQEKTYHVYAQNGGIYQNNRAVQHIYAIGAYQIKDHWLNWSETQKTKVFSMDSDKLKTAEDIVNEFNYAQEQMLLPVSPYYLLRGDLLAFKNTANAAYLIADTYKDMAITDEAYSKIFDKENGKLQTWEDMNRYLIDPESGDGTKILALFSIDKALYVPKNPRLRNHDSLILSYLKITCLWSNLASLLAGTSFEYDKGYAIPDPVDEPIPSTDDPIVVVDDYDNGWRETPKETVQPTIETTPNSYTKINSSTHDSESVELNPKVVGIVYDAQNNHIVLADLVNDDNVLNINSLPEFYLNSSGDYLTYSPNISGNNIAYRFHKNTVFRMISNYKDINSGSGIEVKWDPNADSARRSSKGEFVVVSSKYESTEAKESSLSNDDVKFLAECKTLISNSDDIEDKDNPTEEELSNLLGDNLQKYLETKNIYETEKAQGSLLDDYHYNLGLPSSSWGDENDFGLETAESYYAERAGNYRYRSRSGFLDAYSIFDDKINLREIELAEYIHQAHLTAGIATGVAGTMAAGGLVNSTGSVIDAILTVILATKHEGGFVTYVLGGGRTLEVEGATLHGRIDCTGLIMFVIGLLGWRKYGSAGDTVHRGFSVSNIQSSAMCDTKYVKDLEGNKVSYIDGVDTPTGQEDFMIIKNPTKDQLQAGDFVAYHGHGEIFGICQDGRCYGWNWGYTDGISYTYKAAELARDGADPLEACVTARSTVKGSYEVAFRYIGGGSGTNGTETLANGGALLNTGNASTLQQMINESGVSVSGLGSQLVVVKSKGTSCTVSFWEVSGSNWVMVKSCSGYVGAKGVGKTKEGVSITPKGLWGLGTGDGGVSNEITAFGFHAADSSWKSNLKSKYKDISSGTHYWGGSQNRYSSSYVSGEQISKYKTAYEYAVIIQYNYGNNAYKNGNTGSCFFFHVATGGPTAGCVSVPLSYMKWAMSWLNGTDTKMLIY